MTLNTLIFEWRVVGIHCATDRGFFLFYTLRFEKVNQLETLNLKYVETFRQVQDLMVAG